MMASSSDSLGSTKSSSFITFEFRADNSVFEISVAGSSCEKSRNWSILLFYVGFDYIESFLTFFVLTIFKFKFIRSPLKMPSHCYSEIYNFSAL